jgi:hypothetical protein
MRLTPETFMKTQFGAGVGALFIVLALFSLLRADLRAKGTYSGAVVSLCFLLAGVYILLRHFRVDLL